MTEKRQTGGLRTNQERILGLKAYISSKESSWFWLSLASIFAFFIFSFVTSENVLVLFVKRVTALVFAFLIPGYVITKTIYPEKIDPIERFAFSVAFSVAFIMAAAYVLNYAVITRLSLALTTFSLALVFTFTAVLRGYRTCNQKPDSEIQGGNTKEKSSRTTVLPLLIIGTFAFILNSYDPITSPVLGASDPYLWKYTVDYTIQNGHIPLGKYIHFYKGYPPGFTLIATFLAIFLDIRAYDVMRYIPIFSFLNIIPTYLLAHHIFRSRHISLLAAVLIMSTRFLFHYGSIAVPQMMIHFFLILFLLALLRTLENPSTKNSLVAALLLSSTLLLYHYETTILAIFLPSVFMFVYFHTRIKKSDGPHRRILKSAFIIGTVSALVSGSLWYFRMLPNIARNFLMEGYLNSTQGYFSEQNRYPETYMYILFDGWVLVLFSVIGLALIFLKPKHMKDIRYQFLVIYLFAILFLIEVTPKYIAVSKRSSFYIFSYLAFPLAILASYGLFNIISRITKNIKRRNGLYLSLLMVIFLLNVNSFNYYYTPTEYLDKHLKQLDRGNYNTLFLSGYYWPKPITEHEYDAFDWIRENTPPNSRVAYWYPYRTYAQRICECDPLPTSNLNISDSNSTEITKKTYRWHSRGINIYVLTGLLHDRLAIRFARGRLDFSNKTLESIAADTNFRLVYQNPQIKIYRIEFKNYTVSLDKLGGFRENFTDIFYWGSNLNEKNTLRIKKGIATYRSKTDNQPIDVVFSSGVDTGVYPYFETRMRVVRGKISIGVYDSNGKAHMFLNNFTTNGEWETYKFNLYDWLTRNGYEDNVYGIIITDILDGDKSFRSQIDWMRIHNHIFFDMFNDDSKIAEENNVKVDNGNVTLLKKVAEIFSNSGFENDFKGWRPRAKWGIDSEESHSGNKSAVLYGTVDPAHDASAYLDTKVYRGILKPNTSYRFSMWIKGNVTDAVKGPVRQFGSADLWSRWLSFTQDNKEYSNWTYSEEIITTPDDVNGDFQIRIYGGGNPAVWIDDVSLRENTHESSGTLTSTTITTKNPIVSVMPTWTSTESDGKNITIEISVDNGTTWTGAKSGVQINYTAGDSNKHLLYRAYLQTDDVRRSPVLHDITLTYEEQPHNRQI